MRVRSVAILLALAFNSWFISGIDSLAEEPQAFEAVKKAALEKFKSVKPAERAAGMAMLAGHPSVDAAKVLSEKGLKDRSSDVRQAAYQTLLKFKDDLEICKYLSDTLGKSLQKRTASEEASLLLAVLLASEAPDADREAAKFIDDYLTKSRDGGQLLSSVIDGWIRQGDAPAVKTLTRLARSKPLADNFAFHRGIILSLTRIKLTETVDTLIALLPESKGEVRADMIHFLTSSTGQQLGLDAQLWLQWWQENKATFKFPDAATQVNYQELVKAGLSSYYGLPLYAQRLVFVLDTSGSMTGARIIAAKRELINAIVGLPTDTQFAIVVFNSGVKPWQSKLAAATYETKKAAVKFVESQRAEYKTASYDALESAFRFDAEAVYFLSDGDPSEGKIVQPDQIIEAVTRGNRTRLISIYTIGIGVPDVGGPLDRFMKSLADENFGIYRRVDE